METVVGLLIALSIASERLVEIIKSYVPYLNELKTDPKQESRRKGLLQILAVISGIVTAFLAHRAVAGSLPLGWDSPTTVLALGLLASGGSGFWNAVLTYLLEAKNLKKAEARKAVK